MMRSLLVSAACLMVTTETALAAQGDWLVRLRGIVVAPTEDASAVTPGFPDGSVEVDNAIVPELDFTYFITDHIGAELILATSPHDINGTGTPLADVGELADVMVLPPTLTLQYHFLPFGQIRPYVGVGVNYTIFYNEDASSPLENAIGETDIDLDDSFGVAFQAGVDYSLTDRWFLNADIKYIQIDTTATLNTSGVINEVDVDLDPIVAGFGVGFRF